MNHCINFILDRLDGIWSGMRPFTRRVACIAMILALFPACRVPAAADDSTPIPAGKNDLKFKHAFDLSCEPSYAMIQDRDGFLWMGTLNNGLARFDGYTVKRYLEGPGSVSSNTVTQLMEDRDGLIWIGTGNGLNCYDKQTNTFTGFHADPRDPKAIGNDQFLLHAPTFAEDRAGGLWFGSTGGLSHYDKKTGVFRNYRHDPEDENSLAGNDIWSVALDRENHRLWIAYAEHNRGFDGLDIATGKITHFRHDPGDPASLPVDDVRVVNLDHEGNLWLGRHSQGLVKYDPATGSFTRFQDGGNNPAGLQSATVKSRYLLKSGELIQLNDVDDIGLAVFDTRTGISRHYKNDAANVYSVARGAVMDALEDRDGRLWIIHNTGEVQVYDRYAIQMELYRHSPFDSGSIGSNSPIPVFQDREGTVWIGLFDAGLDRYNSATDSFSHFTHIPGDATTIPQNYPCGFFEDELGNFYVSTYGKLSLFDRKTEKVTRVLTQDSIFYTIRQDPSDPDLLWANGWDYGLSSYRRTDGTVRRFLHNENDPDSLAANTTIRFIIDRDDPHVFWLATWGGGLDRFDTRTEKFKHFKHDPRDPDSVSSNGVYDVVEDAEGKFWVATSNGLNLFSKGAGTFRRLDESNGLPPQFIAQSILEGDDGDLWILSDHGLIHFDRKNERTLRIYTKEDGLHSHAFFPTSSCKTRDGKLWIAGFKGLNVIDPKKLTTNPNRLKIHLVSITRDGKDLNPGIASERLRELSLPWDHSGFEFSFTAIASTNPAQNRFAYRLEGMEESWQMTGNNRSGRYTNIAPGEYVLHIKGANNEGVWDEEGLRIRIRVAPPYWRTAPFIVASSLLVLLVGFLIYRWRVAALRRANRRLEEEVSLRTAEQSKANISLEKTVKELGLYLYILDNATTAVYLIDRSGRFIYVNECAARYSGYTRKELLGMNVDDINTEHTPEGWEKRWGDVHALPKGELNAIRMLHRRKDGSVYPIEILAHHIRHEGRDYQLSVGIDISERERTEEELMRINARTDQALALTRAGYWSVIVGDAHYVASPRCAEILGEEPRPGWRYSVESWADGMEAADPALAVVALESFRKACVGDAPNYDALFPMRRRVDGRVVWLHSLGKVVSAPGRPPEMYGVIQDVTESVESRRELEEARQTAERANRLKSEFLANMSHEIRTPMNGVLGMAELLSRTPLEAAQREQLAMLRSSGEDLLAVINDILDFSKIEAGRMELEMIGFSLHDLAGRTLQALVSQAAAKKLEIELDIPDDLPDLRMGDPNRLRQVLTNLVGNAIKFTERGWVRVVVAQGAGPHGLRVEVTDTGEGISPETQVKLFQPFSQADASTTRRHGGTGLGLVISARIIEQMGGRIGVTSEPGRGSTFWFEISLSPAAPEQVSGPNDRMPALSLLAGKRVLLVDDNAVNRAVAGSLMRRWGMEVTEAADGPEALAQVRAADYELAVLDGAMPGMDGWQLAAAIREIPGCGEIPLIMASSSGLEVSRSSAENSLFRRFLLKPLRPVQLAGALAEALVGWQPDRAAPISGTARGVRVLLVEDTKVNQMVARAMLEKGGHQVELAENGVDALAKLEQPGLFDVILMDCQMPEMDGFEATRQLRLREQERGWQRHRVVAMTANAMESDREACLEAGMDDYLAKPVKMNELLKTVTSGAGDSCSGGV